MPQSNSTQTTEKPLVEEERTRRTPVARLQLFDGEGDELFHFLGCHTVGFGHDDHCRGVQVGKHVYFRVHGGVSPRNKQEDGRAEHNQSVVQGVMYDLFSMIISLIKLVPRFTFEQCRAGDKLA